MIRPIRFEGSHGHSLVGALHLPPEGLGQVAAVLCHGMESSKDGPKHVRLARELSARGLPTLRFDFSGCGESEGRFEDMTYGGEAADLNGALLSLAREGVRRVVLFGSSMGGGVAFLAAGAATPLPVELDALVTLASVGHPDRASRHFLTEEQLSDWRRTGSLPLAEGRHVTIALLDEAKQQDIIGAAGRVQAPVLLIHGSADEVVPIQDAHDLFDAVPHDRKQLVILEGANHQISDPVQMEDSIVRIRDWLLRWSKPEGP